MQKEAGPKILVFDIETAPILGYAWSIWQVDIGLNQIRMDWTVLSYAAKWLHSDKILYQDQRGVKNVRNDKRLLQGLWKLLNEADVVVTQNGIAFDSKKVNARFIQHGMKPPSPYRHIDTKRLAKKYFAFTSNKLEYLAKALGVKHTKSAHKEFPGFELWEQCLGGNKRAWREMEKYNKQDVLATEAVYLKLRAWGTSVDMRSFSKSTSPACPECSSKKVQKRGLHTTNTGKFQRFQCQDCGHWYLAKGAKNNLLSKAKRESLKRR